MSQGMRKIAWFLGVAVTTGTASAADLAATCARLAADPGLAKMRVGYAVLDCDESPDKLIASSDADGLYIPASNMKILTTGVALDVLGPNFQFETVMALDTSGGRNRLTLVGSGDPLLFHPEAPKGQSFRNWTTIQDAVAGWADSVKRANVREVDELVIDARIFDAERLPQDSKKWRDNESQGTYAVGLWGVNMFGNAATIHIGSTAAKPWIQQIEPAFNFTTASNAAHWYDGKDQANPLVQVDSSGDFLQISLKGTIAPGAKLATSVQNVPACIGALLTKLFTEQGVHVAGWKIASTSDAPAPGKVLSPVLITHLSAVLTGANTESINLCADALLKRVAFAKSGEAGSWARGREWMPRLIASRLGTSIPLPAGFAAFDGSGLDDRNRVSPRLLVAWIRSMMNEGNLASDYFPTFAVAGLTGTLGKRFDSAKLGGLMFYGKSGYIDGASCLSGVVVNRATKRSIAYSVLCNKTSKGDELKAAKQLQEKIVIAIADHLRTAPAKQPAIATGN